jgi:hypothetical protein
MVFVSEPARWRDDVQLGEGLRERICVRVEPKIRPSVTLADWAQDAAVKEYK